MHRSNEILPQQHHFSQIEQTQIDYNNQYKYMLNRITRICKPYLINFQRAGFGSDHHDHHGASTHVEINKQATWIKFKTNRKLQALDGIEDTHIPFPDLLDIDPAAHVRHRPWYDLQSIFRGQAFHHSLDHSDLSVADQGYVFADQPNDSRFDMILPSLYTIGAIFTIIFMSEYANINTYKSAEEFICEADSLEQIAHEKLQRKADRIRQLQQSFSKN